MAIHEPGRRLMHFVPLKFVQKRVSGGGGRALSASLNLTSMIDFLVMIVVFLLMTFSASGEIPVDKNVKLPKAENTIDMVDAPMIAVNGSQVNFVDQSTGNPASWLWDFGDTGGSTQRNPIHTYAAAGTYSIVVTVAGIPVLSRLKSMMRSLRLCPPPINRIVVSPELRRPPVRCLGSTNGLCGCLVVISSLTSVVR